ncbi:hypothetical protein EGH24_10080 [Halonotius terrestris]|uniref:DUF1102 domain-containing protein n=1 Tax=Halonotius terrestris TaxID=2487750 RepID=A0A8J8PAN6_9EURY|nr:hypothetical protein [Halonotius terrestris]TQQ79831.1 hypothetical protein EGH24_10080 [Halonotius terrestris]
MGLSRRNTIIGIGTLAVGAGVIGGSGAFDSVEANRSFEVGVTGDDAALLGLEATNDIIAGTQSGGSGENDIIYFRISEEGSGGDAALNENATTVFFDAMRVTNNGNKSVRLSFVFDGGIDGVAFTLAEERNDTSRTDLVSEGYVLTPGESISLDLRIDTTADGGYVEPADGEPYQITIQAVSTE